jgi:Tol biopolymer transport system component
MALAAVTVLLPMTAAAATRYDPRLRFRTISTRRFDIHFHQREELLARRLAGLVENAAAEVDAAVGAAVGRVQVILVDQNDLSNGWATPLPYNTIEISAAAPPAESSIGNTSDWLRLVFVHEYTHIAHLSRAGGWINGLRHGFGRMPLLFPNLFQPVWAIEGVATWQESTVTHEGRVVAGDFRLLLDRASAANRFEPLDRVNGGNVDWPGGTGSYLYGAYFHDFLARKYGAGSIRTLAAETARRLPYFGSRAYKKVFGRSLGQLWKDFEEAERSSGRSSVDSRAVRLTHHGFQVSTPRHAPDGRLFYSVATPHAFPALMELSRSDVAASGPRPEPRVVATRFLGGAIALSGSRLIVDELELLQSVALQSDLWTIDPRTGARKRLTREARAGDPDVSPDGATIVCTIQMADRRALATIPAGTGLAAGGPQVFISEPGVEFAGPRWSPDGRSIAAERRIRGGPSEIVLIDVATKQARAIASLPGGRSGSAAWMPDGRHVLFAAAVNDEPFRIYRVDIGAGAITRLEGTGPSGQFPDVSPDGARVVFVGNTADGYDLFALGLDDARWTAVEASASAVSSPSPDAAGPAALFASSTGKPYSPLPTLAPTFWTPTIESDAGELVVGAATGSADALGRHAYGIEGGWSARARPDWQVAYAYDRWRPTLFAAYTDDTDPWRNGEVRTRDVEAGMLLPRRHIRSVQSVLTSVRIAEDAYECAACEGPVDASVRRSSGRGGFSFNNAHQFGYSISAEEGGRLTATAEASRGHVRQASAPSVAGDGVALTIDARHYWRAGRPHDVIAIRGAAAAFWGDDAARQLFSASGNGPVGGGFGFGVDAIGLLRGFDQDDVVGTRAAVINVDYRLPLWRVGRGFGTLPVFVRTVHAAVFADAGHGWSDAARWDDVRTACGGELSVDTVVGFGLPVTFTAGAAVRHDGVTDRSSVVAFGRVGRAF